ncbi:hypothetical protein [Amaricoccus solimangrovi]|uniref:Uncharacterized protein n=1 Tax=Amaricoccus solimangrovi TaxID=2589815 RepID=A0A501WEP5_9RHOB|nr:hypothetical protein [Amaricoccus solimangrovi]TPE47888.1 hypothetical protein FJM51_19325 [Amaricoccus solimangrovi]
MRAHVFRSEAGSYALATGRGAAALPARLGPWRREREIVIDGGDAGRIGLAPEQIEALRRDGVVLLPGGLIIDD